MSKEEEKSLTAQMVDANVAEVRSQIFLKQGCQPYYGTMNGAESVITDMDHFPYTRFYRGVYNSSDPVTMEREAGWRPTRNPCYSGGASCDREGPYPNHCFETACSTVYPCYPRYMQKFSDRDALNVQLNRSCIVQYR